MIKDSNFWDEFSNIDNKVILLEGTRKITAQEFESLSDIGKRIKDIAPNSIFRSGNAPGTDSAFMQQIVLDEKSKVELILPFKKHRSNNVPNNTIVISLDDLLANE